MASYIRRTDDVKYRKVSIKSAIIPVFEEFTGVAEAVQYTDLQVVEVLRKDGSTALFHESGVEVASYSPGGPDRFLISQNIPRERIWMRRTDGTGIPYKVPNELPVKGNSVEFRVPCGVQGMELFGDKYFEMVYQLQRA